MQLRYNSFMDGQLSLRLPADLARRLGQRARARGIKRSVIVREALEAFLAAVPARLAPLVGAVKLNRAAIERDALARQLRDHNWRG